MPIWAYLFCITTVHIGELKYGPTGLTKTTVLATTIFPKNWPPMRVKMEVAHAYKNKVFVRKELKDGVVVEIYRGKCSVGFKIEFIYNDGVLVSTPPKLNFNKH